jgi:hypothetical protein
VRILALEDPALAAKMEEFQKKIAADARAQDGDVSRGAARHG